MSITRVDFIRHGEPAGGDIFRGLTDHPLTAKGQWQFQERIKRCDKAWDLIVTSPLLRCADSAYNLAQQLHIPVQTEPRFREIDFGEWETLTFAEVLQDSKYDVQTLWQDPLNFCAPQGESSLALQERSLLAWHDLLADHQGKRILVVTHGGVMRLLAHHLVGLSAQGINRLAVPHAALMSFRVHHDPEPWVLLESMDGSDLIDI